MSEAAGTGRLHSIQELVAALSAGTFNAATLRYGNELQIEDLSVVYRCVTFEMLPPGTWVTVHRRGAVIKAGRVWSSGPNGYYMVVGDGTWRLYHWKRLKIVNRWDRRHPDYDPKMKTI